MTREEMFIDIMKSTTENGFEFLGGTFKALEDGTIYQDTDYIKFESTVLVDGVSYGIVVPTTKKKISEGYGYKSIANDIKCAFPRLINNVMLLKVNEYVTANGGLVIGHDGTHFHEGGIRVRLEILNSGEVIDSMVFLENGIIDTPIPRIGCVYTEMLVDKAFDVIKELLKED